MPAARSAATLSKGGKVWRPARRKGQAMRWRAARGAAPRALQTLHTQNLRPMGSPPHRSQESACRKEAPPLPPLEGGGKRYAPPKPLSLRTSPQAGVAIRNTLTPHPCHMGNGFPRRCAPRNDIFTKTILSCVGAGFYPARLHAAERENGRGRAVAPTHVLQISL